MALYLIGDGDGHFCRIILDNDNAFPLRPLEWLHFAYNLDTFTVRKCKLMDQNDLEAVTAIVNAHRDAPYGELLRAQITSHPQVVGIYCADLDWWVPPKSYHAAYSDRLLMKGHPVMT